jgi:peptidoglycan/xylan/chitin deacetylase (PgdA/CDA1 family)
LIVALLALFAVIALANGGHSGRRVKAGRVAGRPPAPPAHVHAPARSRLAALDAIGDTNIRRLARLGLPIYCAGPRGREVAFTFDDGPGPYTYLALKKLREAGDRATFFVVGRSMDFFPGHLPSELRLAAIGDHTYTHPVLPSLSSAGITSEIQRTEQKIEAQIGERVYLFRPPYGARDGTVDQIARQLGVLEILWTVDSGDSLGANWAGIIRNVEAGLRPGAIVLMHENRGQTIRALTTLLPELHRRHLRSVSLPELFASDPPSVAQVRRGSAGCAASPSASARPGT